MKTTLEIPDEIFRRTKAAAALRGESLKEVVTRALQTYLDRRPPEATVHGWRSVYGKARRKAVEEVDAVVASELEGIEPDNWR